MTNKQEGTDADLIFTTLNRFEIRERTSKNRKFYIIGSQDPEMVIFCFQNIIEDKEQGADLERNWQRIKKLEVQGYEGGQGKKAVGLGSDTNTSEFLI